MTTVRGLRSVYDKHGEKVRFLLVGAWNTLFSIGVLWVLERLVPYDPDSLPQKELVLVAQWVIGITHNFFTFKLLVFRTKGSWVREYARMYVTYAATFVIQSAFVLAITELFEWTLFWANLPTVVIVTIMSYFGHKHFTFARPEEVFEDKDGP